MEIQCPHCSSRFNLPDKLVKPGAKLRCSVCKNVFALETPAKEAPAKAAAGKTEAAAAKKAPAKAAAPVRKEKKGSSIFVWLGLLLFLIVLGGSGYWYYIQFPTGNKKPQLSDEELAQRVSMLTMRNVRQYYVNNEKIGKVCVIVGDVRNEFPQPKALIRVEAAVYDKDKKPLAVKQQLAGSQLSLFQLQVLGEKELESFLQSSTDIYIRNSNVPPGGEVPFMVLFYVPSEKVAEFGVRIAGVEDVAPQPGMTPAQPVPAAPMQAPAPAQMPAPAPGGQQAPAALPAAR
ncbi:MAG TPA: zinc-ribbon domain-containing protein [Candidatus Desulfovibrio gallistercoris]|uniref:DUF3426 domain-containing protein n=1 Tax=uncultured Desulfovibrio sp. TaxID=167968 RepID=UPI001FA2B485|nr:DUF3426 domain-containing protein [uncultured Desulfovibrio sp.]HJA75329.1 zinc-ribbon domain-containing protein [Candidatus Desulfovibrio gallistercoris]